MQNKPKVGHAFPTQPFPLYGQQGVMSHTVPGSMSPPGVVQGTMDPSRIESYGPLTPSTVQTPDAAYWQGQSVLAFSTYASTILPAGVAEPLPLPVQIAVWASPVFDIRPNLVAPPQQSTGQPLARGSKAQLDVKVQINTVIPLLPPRVYNVYALESGDPFNPTNVSPLIGLEPVYSLMSSNAGVTPGGRVCQACFTPPPGIRFWQVQLVFCLATPGATAGTVNLWASAY